MQQKQNGEIKMTAEMKLEDILHPEQYYVSQSAAALGLPVHALYHENATDTCHEKAQLLGWPAERVVKIVFFHTSAEVYGFVLPELGEIGSPSRIDVRELLPGLLGCTRSHARSFRNSYCPEGMEYGTCTPFALASSFEDDSAPSHIDKIFIHEMPSLHPETVDISIGGKGEEAHRLSLHLPYEGIYQILARNFPGKVEWATLL